MTKHRIYRKHYKQKAQEDFHAHSLSSCALLAHRPAKGILPQDYPNGRKSFLIRWNPKHLPYPQRIPCQSVHPLNGVHCGAETVG